MKAKNYQIKTVQDMIDCTNELNLDDFLTDLRGTLTAAHTIRTIAESKGLPKIDSEGFIWVDDGKFDHKVDIYINDVLQFTSQSELLYCPGCGKKKKLIVESDINSDRVCKNKLCNQK